PHALPAPAGRRLDDHGEADLLRDLQSRLRVLDRSGRARHRGHLELLRQLAGGGLVAHLADLVPARAHERDVRRPHDIGEFGVLPAVREQHLLEHQGAMSPRSPAAAVVPPNAWLSPESTPETFSANSLGFVA